MKKLALAAVIALCIFGLGAPAYAEQYAGRTLITDFSGGSTNTVTLSPGGQVATVRLKYASAQSYTLTIQVFFGDTLFQEASVAVTSTADYKYALSNTWVKQGDRIVVTSTIANTATLIITYLR
jgi:hypothetical protein